MDNPVNVAFLSTGERILSCTFFQHPEAGRRDGLIHAIYGGVYGKRHESIYSHKMTGDVMPVLVHQGAAAPCGLIAGSSSLLGGGHADNLFACDFNLHKVVRHELAADGPTFRTVDTDFVACDHPDFHPTDVFEDADGSLLVIDTGGWYKVCCPTSQLAKPDVLGAIYRVRKKGSPRADDPLGAVIDWRSRSPGDLAGLLADERLFVQRRAAVELRRLGDAAVPPLAEVLRKDFSSAVCQQAVWTLAGIDSAASRAAVRDALADKSPAVVQAALHVAALWRDRDALDSALPLVTSRNQAIARVAAEAVGRIGEKQAVPTLLRAIEQLSAGMSDPTGAPADTAQRISEHALVYALIEIGDAKRTAAGLVSRSPQVRRAALVALDQMDGGGLIPEQVIGLLDHSDPTLRGTAQWIVGHRPEWGEALVGYFRQRLATKQADEADRAQLASQLAQLGKSPAIQKLLAAALGDKSADSGRLTVLKAMAEAKPTVTPPAWLEELARLLPQADGEVLVQAIATTRALPLPKNGHASLKGALLEVGRRRDLPLGVRLAALTAAGNVGEVQPALFQVLLASVMPDQPLELRTPAAAILASASLTADQRLSLLDTASRAGPFELPKLLPAFEREPTEAQGMKLVAALSSSAGIRGLRTDLVKPLLARYPASVQSAGEKLLAQLNASASEQAALLDELLGELPAGDFRRGHEVFVSQKAACATCHAVGYLGGRLGPDLTNIGKVRTDRDLVESIVFPSASFVRSYEPVLLRLDDGRSATGILVRETASELVLATGPQQEMPVPRAEIVAIQPGTASLMPQGIVSVLTKQELADLVAFLKVATR
jgi:putative heme-binding domain-containing protein